jgi:uncharacterized membrane protein
VGDMEWLLWLAVSLVGLFVYVAIAAAAAHWLWKTCEMGPHVMHGPEPLLFGMFWPIVLAAAIAALPFYLVGKVVNPVKLGKRIGLGAAAVLERWEAKRGRRDIDNLPAERIDPSASRMETSPDYRNFILGHLEYPGEKK